MGSRLERIRWVLWVVLALNLAVAAAKLAVGWWADSISMIADGFHSTLDGSSNVIGLIGMWLAGQPPDANHPYGHQKFESIAALAIGVLLALTGVEVIQAALGRWGKATLPHVTWLGFTVMGVTMVVNVGVAWYEAREGRRLGSHLLLADAQHTRSDLLVSTSVLGGLIAARMGVAWLDVVVALLIAAFIIWVAYGVLKQVTFSLTDTAYLGDEAVSALALQVPRVRRCKNVRSRGNPPFLFIDLEVELDPDLSLAEAHAIAHQVMDRCRERLDAADVVVHVEPWSGRGGVSGPGGPGLPQAQRG